MQSDASTDKRGDGVILYVKYIKYTRVRYVFFQSYLQKMQLEMQQKLKTQTSCLEVFQPPDTYRL